MLRRRSHRRADEFRLGRIAAKVAIASVGITADPNLVCIGVGVFGQPVVLGDCRGVRVGIAHSGGYAASVAFDQSFPMGVDVEVRSERTCRVVSQHLGDEFIDRFVGHGVDPDLAPLAAWTGREALGKTLLTGLTAAEDVLSCRPVSSSVDQVVEIVFDKIPQYRGLSMVGGRFGLALTVPRQVLETDVELPDRLNRVVGPLCRSVSRC